MGQSAHNLSDLSIRIGKSEIYISLFVNLFITTFMFVTAFLFLLNICEYLKKLLVQMILYGQVDLVIIQIPRPLLFFLK